VGHVVFFGFHPRTVSRLMTSRLETLQGHFPLTATTALRFANLHYYSNKKAGLVKTFKNILCRPFIASSVSDEIRAPLQMQLQLQLRFSLEYCVKMGMLDPVSGGPIGMAQFAMHLHKHSPANILFASMLMDGTLTKVCNTFTTNRAQAAQDMLLIMAHLFFRIPMPTGVHTNPFKDDPECQGDVLLPAAPKEIMDRIAAHDADSVALYTHCMRVFSKASLSGVSSNKLPVSQAVLPAAATSSASSLFGSLQEQSVRSLARSPFACLSGHDDSFDDTSDVLLNSREGITLGAVEDLPLVQLYNTHGDCLSLNGYAMDFYKHGSKDALLKYNNLLPKNVWFIIKDWSNLINQITDAINMMMPNNEDEDNIYKTFSYLGDKFKERVREMNASTHKTVAGEISFVSS
jgi:hypothetical protein